MIGREGIQDVLDILKLVEQEKEFLKFQRWDVFKRYHRRLVAHGKLVD